MGEVVYVYDDDPSDVMLDLKMNPGSKFMSDYEEISLYVDGLTTYEIGDKLFVYCADMIEHSLPPALDAKCIFRYERAR